MLDAERKATKLDVGTAVGVEAISEVGMVEVGSTRVDEGREVERVCDNRSVKEIRCDERRVGEVACDE